MYVLQKLFESSSFLFFATLSQTPGAVVADPSLGNSEIKNNTITHTLSHTFSSCAESLKFLPGPQPGERGGERGGATPP